MIKLIKNILIVTLFTSCVHAEDDKVSDTKIADQISFKHCKLEFCGANKISSSPYVIGSSSVRAEDVNKQMFLYRLIELKDGKLNAYLAKDIIQQRIQTYEGFVKTDKEWRQVELTEERKKKFLQDIIELKKELTILEEIYPRDSDISMKVRNLHPVLSKLPTYEGRPVEVIPNILESNLKVEDDVSRSTTTKGSAK